MGTLKDSSLENNPLETPIGFNEMEGHGHVVLGDTACPEFRKRVELEMTTMGDDVMWSQS
jgi:hypothetical protein